MAPRSFLVGLIFAAGCTDPAGVLEIEQSSERTIIGLTDEAHVLRTESNVGHIYAQNELDAHRVQGWVMAKDRYVQLELTRRLGAGSLSEVLGDIGLSIDLDSAGRGLRFIGDRIWATLPDDVKARYEAFADGVNTYVEAVRAGELAVPSELEIVAGFRNIDDAGLLAQPVTGKDIAYAAAVIMSQLGYETRDPVTDAAAKQIADTFGNEPLAELRRAGLMQDILHAYAPVHAFSQAMPGAVGVQGLTAKGKPSFERIAGPSLEQLERLNARNDRWLRRIGRPPRQDHGSNSWAVSSKGTGGGALLANDGHLPLTVPSIFYRMCLAADYLGGEGMQVCGLYFPGLPSLGVGTNGRVAWGQTYLDADLNDWYAEEIKLDAAGLPAESLFQGEWRALAKHDETFNIGADKDPAPAKFEKKTFSRWTTFDGRWLMSIEGQVVSSTTTGAVIVLQGDYIIPGDRDGDGVVRGVTMDWTAFDQTETLAAVDAFARSESVEEFKEHTKKLVGYGQNIVVADGDREIMYSRYHVLPCREGLERSGGQWSAGSDPHQLLDGTQHGAMDVASGGCLIPFEVGPRSVTPEAGYVLTANHDPIGNTFDDSLADDTHYIGGPYSPGYRAKTIDEGLAALANAKQATVQTMGELQGSQLSPIGLEHAPRLISTIERAKGLAATGTTTTDGRVRALYDSDKARIDDAATRLKGWLDRGGHAMSGVDTFYASPTATEKQDAVATMIHGSWSRNLIDGVFGDEDIEFIWIRSRQRMVYRTMHRLLEGRGANNPLGIGSFNPDTNESAFFDVRGTAIVETSDEIILQALLDAFAELERSLGRDMDGWLWGLEHKVRFESLLTQIGGDSEPAVGVLALEFSITTDQLPLAPEIPRGDPRGDLEHFPRNGDFFSVDAAAPSMADGRYYTYAHGPVMRMVIHLDDGKVTGQTILPGGQSGSTRSKQFADQAAVWLGNETQPIRYHAEDVVEGATSRERYIP